MKVNLTRGMTKEDASHMKQLFLEAKPLRDRLIDYMDEKIQAHMTVMMSKDSYNNEWAYKQADSIGYMRALKELKSLLNDEKTYSKKNSVGRPKIPNLSVLEK